jgi:hypothetical protein
VRPHVFVGPSLPAPEVLAVLDAHLLPPAVAGDVLRSALEEAPAILLIDGLYESVASVRHKEILFALSRGVRVLGCSSMGALRASELDVYGMEGVGQVYEWYRTGILEDDDEVAVRHGPASDGFRPLSEALVNIRALLQHAQEQELLSPDLTARLLAHARGLHYAGRSWPALVEAAPALGVPQGVVTRLAALARQGVANVKAADARRALARLSSGATRSPVAAPFILEETIFLRQDLERARLASRRP